MSEKVEFLVCKTDTVNGLLTANQEELEILEQTPLVINVFDPALIGPQTVLQKAIFEKVLSLVPPNVMSAAIIFEKRDNEFYAIVEFLKKGSIFDKADKAPQLLVPKFKKASVYVAERTMAIKVTRKNGDVNKFIGVLTSPMDPLRCERQEWANALSMDQLTDLELLLANAPSAPIVITDSFDACYEKLYNKRLPVTMEGVLPLFEFHKSFMSLPSYEILGSLSKDTYSDICLKLSFGLFVNC